MDILGKARRLESKIANRLDRAAQELVRSGAREPLEILHAILEAIEQEIQSGGRGKRIFPFNRIVISVLAPSREARARFEAVFGQSPVRVRILERLRSARCEVSDVTVELIYVARAPKTWRNPEFHVDFARVAKADHADGQPDPQAFRIEVTVLRGVAEQRTYCLPAKRIDLGRCAEVRDSCNRLIRTNQVAFVPGGSDINETVSRQHAHIDCQPSSGHCRIHDDGSGQGTGIVRDGRTISVPRGSRGVRLHSGDEIVLGEARVRIRFQADKSSSPSYRRVADSSPA